MFKGVYTYTFEFGKVEGQKSLPLDTAIALWELLLPARYIHLQYWFTFLKVSYIMNESLKEKHGKSISKDTWNLFWDFIEGCRGDYDQHDDEGMLRIKVVMGGAWPVLIDSFVPYMKELIKKGNVDVVMV